MTIRRQGNSIIRRFNDEHFGSEKASLAQARRYRDMVHKAFPVLTRNELSRNTLQRSQTTEALGISADIYKGRIVAYRAHFISVEHGRLRKTFNVKRYGEERAKTLALEQRQQWVQLHAPADSDKGEARSFAERLTAFNKEFDELFPPPKLEKPRDVTRMPGKGKGKAFWAQRHHVPSNDTDFSPEGEYAIARTVKNSNKAGLDFGEWSVALGRRGQQVARRFADNVYGSSQASLDMARAWRDAVMTALPPVTNHEMIRTPNASNTSGVPGVSLRTTTVGGQDYDSWVATHPRKMETRSYGVATHGGDHAKKLAIAQREQWLSKHPSQFRAREEIAIKVSEQSFPERLIPDVPPPISDLEFRARLDEINQHFDALRPCWLFVRLYIDEQVLPKSPSGATEKGLKVYMSKIFRPTDVIIRKFGFRRRSLAGALECAREHVRETIGQWYGEEIAIAFMREYEAILGFPAFDPEAGAAIKMMLSARFQTPAYTARIGARTKAHPKRGYEN